MERQQCELRPHRGINNCKEEFIVGTAVKMLYNSRWYYGTVTVVTLDESEGFSTENELLSVLAKRPRIDKLENVGNELNSAHDQKVIYDNQYISVFKESHPAAEDCNSKLNLKKCTWTVHQEKFISKRVKKEIKGK